MNKKLFWLFTLLFLVSVTFAGAQPLPIRVGYVGIGSVTTPLWMAKELDLFERHGIQSSPIYMASTLAYQAMLAGETDFTVGGSILPIQARLGGAAPLILLTYISGFAFSIMARPPILQPSDLRGKRLGVTRFGSAADLGAGLPSSDGAWSKT